MCCSNRKLRIQCTASVMASRSRVVPKKPHHALTRRTCVKRYYSKQLVRHKVHRCAGPYHAFMRALPIDMCMGRCIGWHSQNCSIHRRKESLIKRRRTQMLINNCVFVLTVYVGPRRHRCRHRYQLAHCRVLGEMKDGCKRMCSIEAPFHG